MNEVIINKGYYTEKQRYSVGNVGHIDSKDIEKQPVQNILLAMQGRIPGLIDLIYRRVPTRRTLRDKL